MKDGGAILSSRASWPNDRNGQPINWGDVVRDEDGSAWVLAANDPLDSRFDCAPVLLHAQMDLLHAERLTVDILSRTVLARDQPNILGALRAAGFQRDCTRSLSLQNGTSLDKMLPPDDVDRGGCGCRHAPPGARG